MGSVISLLQPRSTVGSPLECFCFSVVQQSLRRGFTRNFSRNSDVTLVVSSSFFVVTFLREGQRAQGAPGPGAADGHVPVEECQLSGQDTLRQRAGERHALAQVRHSVGESHRHGFVASRLPPSFSSLHPSNRSGHAFRQDGPRRCLCISAWAMNQDFTSWLGTARFLFLATGSVTASSLVAPATVTL